MGWAKSRNLWAEPGLGLNRAQNFKPIILWAGPKLGPLSTRPESGFYMLLYSYPVGPNGPSIIVIFFWTNLIGIKTCKIMYYINDKGVNTYRVFAVLLSEELCRVRGI